MALNIKLETVKATRAPLMLSIITSLYLFILSIELIKDVSIALTLNHTQYLQILSSPTKAAASGWLFSALVQSGGSPSAAAIAMLSAGAISLSAALYFMFGTFIGKTVTEDIISLISRASKRKDFRHGFEIALTANIYNISLFFIAILLEHATGMFSKIASTAGHSLEGTSLTTTLPNITKAITDPITSYAIANFNILLIFIIGFALLMLSLDLLSKSVLHFWGGPKQGRKFIKNYLGTTSKAFLAGLLITLIIPSTNLTISLLIPLAVSRIIKLREAVPYIIGANVGTVSEVILAALVVGKQAAIGAVISYALVPVIGAIIWMPFCKQLHDITKYFTKHFTKISREKAIAYLALFILVPALMLLL